MLRRRLFDLWSGHQYCMASRLIGLCLVVFVTISNEVFVEATDVVHICILLNTTLTMPFSVPKSNVASIYWWWYHVTGIIRIKSRIHKIINGIKNLHIITIYIYQVCLVDTGINSKRILIVFFHYRVTDINRLWTCGILNTNEIGSFRCYDPICRATRISTILFG